MVAIIGPAPKLYLVDLNGNPLAGGKIYTYAAGTLTPLATYADYNQDAVNTNPIILDSSGMAEVFWLPATLYDVIVTDANDVQLYTTSSYSVGGGSSGSSNPGFGAATDIPSSTTVDMGSISSHFANITGTVPINSFGNTASIDAPLYLVKAQSAGLVINLSGNILAPMFTNEIYTGQNDYWWMEYLGSGAWKIFEYNRGDGTQVGNTGKIEMWPGATLPTGALYCDGSAVSRTGATAALFAKLGTVWGTGDGTTTFNIPDLRGRGPFGRDDMGGSAANRITNAVSGITATTLGATGGDQNTQLHSHVLTDPGHAHAIQMQGSPTSAGNFVPQAGASVPGGVAATNSANTGITMADFGTGASQNMPPAAIVNFIIWM